MAVRVPRARSAIALAFFACLATVGCGGGSSGSSALPPASPPAVASSATVTLSIAVPAASSSGKRRARYVSSSTRSATIDYGQARQIVPCTTTCSATLQVVPGPVTFTLALYDGDNGTGNVLSTGATTATIVPGANTVAIAMEGVVAALALDVSPNTFTSGTPAKAQILVHAFDAAGRVIAGSDAYASPVTLALDDASHFTLSATRVAAPSDGPTVSYDGSAVAMSAHLSATIPNHAAAAGQATLSVTTPVLNTVPSQSAASADAFVGSIGVNIHLHDTGTPYDTSFDALRTLLIASGIRHVRDGLIDTTWQPYYDRLNALAAAGIHADLVSAPTQTAALIAAYPARVSGVIDAIEAPNEYPVTSVASAATLSSFQTLLYQAVRGNAATAGFTVIGPSLTSQAQYAAVGDLSSVVDGGNMHDYFGGRNPGTSGWGGTDRFGTYGSLQWNLAIARQADVGKPIYATENGYNEASTSSTPVPAAIKARYLQRMLLEHWNAGVARTYIYQMLDEGTNTDSFGLVDSFVRPKPAYAAVKNLIARLSDPGPAMSPVSIGLGFTAAASVHHTLLARRDGSYALIAWVELPAWDVNGQTPIAVAAQPVTVVFARAPSSVSVGTFDDAGSLTSAPATVSAAATLTLQADDRVTVVDVRP